MTQFTWQALQKVGTATAEKGSRQMPAENLRVWCRCDVMW